MSSRSDSPIPPILAAALAAVEPAAAVRRALQRQGETLIVRDQGYDLAAFRRLIVIGAGKAGAPMAQAVAEILGDHIDDGYVVVKYGHGPKPGQTIAPLRIVEAGHPTPDQPGLEAGAEVLRRAEGAGPNDLVICLLSGGGSALLEALPPGLTLADLQITTDSLLASGAAIREINTLRKRLSLVKGGQLARAIAPAACLTLVVSDVVGSPLEAIASGPTAPDPSTWADAWAVVERYHLAERLPAAVRQRLEAGRDGALPETPKPGDPIFAQGQIVIVADNAIAAEAARAEAERQGFQALVLTTSLEGEARQAAEFIVSLAGDVKTYHRPLAPPACLILGGETTVTLADCANPGRGGRNQELALAAALALAGCDGITVVSLGTDGSDGPTDAAGGMADGETAARGLALGLDASDHLRRHDAYPFLEAVGGLLRTGPTRTNVNDLVLALVSSPTIAAVGDSQP
jgi:hydroxypyruvate reductase